MISLSYIEFYSGIGGWGYALEHACRSIIRRSADDVSEADQRNKKKAKLTDSCANEDDTTCVHPPFITTKLLAAYDHSDLCNAVFAHNHTTRNKQSKISKGHKPRQTPIEKISQQELELHNASVWCMSPPCQPHTRQHSNQHKEIDDPRSKSFLHLCHMLNVMDENRLPCLLLLENVVGFEDSWDNSSPNLSRSNKATRGSFGEWRNVLSQRQYEVAHFHLDPTHVNIPNNRPRYYCVAIRREGLRRRLLRDLIDNFWSKQLPHISAIDKTFSREKLDEKPDIHNESSLVGLDTDSISDRNRTTITMTPQIKYFLDADLTLSTSSRKSELIEKLKSLQISEKVRSSSSAWCFDIITPYHTCSACFTHSYGKFIKGTGSILYGGPLRLDNEADAETDKSIPTIEKFQLASPDERSFDENWSSDIDWDHMRYLSGTEIARLMGFPVSEPAIEQNERPSESNHCNEEVGNRSFSFPSNCTMKQRWKLLGNSLNVKVAAKVAELGIHALLNDVAK